MLYENNKGTDQPLHLCSLISIFIIHCVDSIRLYIVAISIIPRLASFLSLAGMFESYLVAEL